MTNPVLRILPAICLCLIAMACGRAGFVSNDAMLKAGAVEVYPDSVKCAGLPVATASGPLALEADGKTWRADSVRRAYPLYASEHPVVDALYNRCMAQYARHAGARLAAPFSRYAIDEAMAIADPRAAMALLRGEVNERGYVTQPGGAGGSWPVVADRAMWVVAAWEVYKMTGDRRWLAEAFRVAERTLQTDYITLLSPQFGLMHGIPLGLDDTRMFPEWMTGADFYTSMCLVTSAAYSAAYTAANAMAEELGRPRGEYTTWRRALNASINERLWIPNLGCYSQYLYTSPYPLQSQATDNLGQAMCVVFGIAEQEGAVSVLTKTPCYDSGLPRAYPQIADTGAVVASKPLPEVLAYWTRAAARMSCGGAQQMSMAWQILAAARHGDADNARSCIRSAMSFVSMIYRVVAGLRPEADRLVFAPSVPPGMGGDKWLSGVRYRKAVLDIVLHGTGNRIANFTIDGKTSHSYSVDSALTGRHTVEITLANNRIPDLMPQVVAPARMPSTPVVEWTSERTAKITQAVEGTECLVYLNDDLRDEMVQSTYQLYDARNFTTVSFVPVAFEHYIGYTPRPYRYIPRDAMFTVDDASLDAYRGTSLTPDRVLNERLIEVTPTRNTHLTFDVEVPMAGDYFIDVCYANGAGPRLNGRNCAVRTLLVNGVRAGTLVFAQLGKDKWTLTGFTNPVAVHLNGGRNTVSIDYVEPYNVNVTGDESRALIDYIRFIKR